MQPVVNVFIEKMRETRGNRQKAASLSAQSFSDYDNDDDVEYLNNRGFLPQSGTRVVQGDQEAWTKPPVDIDVKVSF